MNNNCIFCKIINKEIESKIVFEDENIVAFLDIEPKAKGHTLVVPKKHYENIMEKDDDVDLINSIKEVVIQLKKTYNFIDFKLINNNGAKAGQEVYHIHFHIIPFF